MSNEEDEQEDDLPPPLQHQKSAQTGPKQDLKLDQSSGRVGNPPGLGCGPGSSHLLEVKDPNEIGNVDEVLFPPMDHEELELFDSIMLDAGKVPTGQGDQLEQGRQLNQQHPQDLDSTCQLLHKLDLPTGGWRPPRPGPRSRFQPAAAGRVQGFNKE